MGFKEAIRTCFREKYVTFSGRASRSEYWYFMLFVILISSIPIAIGGGLFAVSYDSGNPSILGGILMGLGSLVYLAVLLPMISVTVRRYHDRNLSGWWILAITVAGMIPFVGWLASVAGLVITVLKGTDGDNRFGPDPLRAQHQADVFA